MTPWCARPCTWLSLWWLCGLIPGRSTCCPCGATAPALTCPWMCRLVQAMRDLTGDYFGYHIGSDAWQPMPYMNRRGVWGMHVGFWHAYQYHAISVHNCPHIISASKLAHLISGIESIDDCRFGIFANKKDILGFYATAKSTYSFEGSCDHWFMISRSPEKYFARILQLKTSLSEEEQDLLCYLESRENKKFYFTVSLTGNADRYSSISF